MAGIKGRMRLRLKKSAGMMRLGCLLPLITIALLWAGGQGLYTALTNRHLTVLTYEEYVRTKPHASWLELKNCVLALPEASYRSSKVTKEIKEAFIPVHAAAGQEPDKVHVLVATEEKETLALLQEVNTTEGAE